MNSSQTDLRFADNGSGVARRLGHAAEAVVGGAAVGALGLTDASVRWVGKSDSWILFLLLSKPLIDLTWNWRFFRIAEQGVNIQTFAGLFTIGLNAIAISISLSWRRLPQRVLIFLACALLSLLISPSSWGINEYLRLLTGTLFFYTAGPVLADPERFDRFAKGFLLIVAVPVVFSFGQLAGVLPYSYWDWAEGEQIGRVSGLYETPLGLVFLFIYAFPVALHIAFGRSQSLTTRSLAWIFLMLATLSLAFTYHRAGYIAIALEVIIWLYLSKGRKAAISLLAVLTLLTLLSMSWLRILYAPLEQVLQETTAIESDELLRGRGFQWVLYMNSFVSSGPVHWVFGLGGSVIAGVDEGDRSYVLSPNEPHNDFIRILHAYGIVGLLLYISILALFLRRALQLLKSCDSFPRTLALVTLPALIAVVILSITTEPMRYPTAVWYLFAVGSAMFCMGTNARTTQTPSLQP
jgi:O-antigen ligase